MKNEDIFNNFDSSEHRNNVLSDCILLIDLVGGCIKWLKRR